MLLASIPSALGNSAEMQLKLSQVLRHSLGTAGSTGYKTGRQRAIRWNSGISELMGPTPLTLHRLGDKCKMSPSSGKPLLCLDQPHLTALCAYPSLL